MPAKTVLLVDDDADLLDAHRAILEAAGFAVLTADNGEAGFAAAAANPVDVAILDVMMDTPTEGFDLARRLRLDARTRHVPLLMLTSVNAENETIGSFVRISDRDRDRDGLPVDRFVDKPVKPEELVAIVRTLAGAWSLPSA
jgi:DNA-binding response OmpR family regulator